MAERLILTDTTRPLRLAYDGSNYADFAVSAAGKLTITPKAGQALETQILTVTGGTTLTTVVADVVRKATSDGADNLRLQLAGGGDALNTRGSYVNLCGNEHASTGSLQCIVGDVAGGSFEVYTGASVLRQLITRDGVIAFGTSVVTSAAAGEVVLANAKALRSVNGAGTDTLALIYLDSNSLVQAGRSGVGLSIPVVANASLQAAGSAALNGLLVIDSTNDRLCFYSGAGRRYVTGTPF